MSALAEMVAVYSIVAVALIYVTRGWIMKFLFKKSPDAQQGCGSCESGGCASCKIYNVPHTNT